MSFCFFDNRIYFSLDYPSSKSRNKSYIFPQPAEINVIHLYHNHILSLCQYSLLNPDHFLHSIFKRKFKNTTNHTTYKFLVQSSSKPVFKLAYLSIRGRYISTISCIASLSLILALHKTPTNHPSYLPSVFVFF